ncbi:carbohydrate ABC transporter permease [Thorsellia anophelis]|uniref:Multiple sugar transport system permease protein n=1 Tax=Thorsellia anophelis DSM 18579 TaxID=1123402 RepID=A0A1I0E116_9GAMM|nr:carbohydrate ABC transporter permease [Thorsellia anophelis]SET37867.1 multiple sugar transport system permease protein [Thorsellia anophelis DSM 18579]
MSSPVSKLGNYIYHNRQKIIPSIILILIAITFLLPFLWMALTAFDKNASTILKMPNLTLDNFEAVLGKRDNYRSILIGLVMAFATGIGIVVIAILAAYPLSRYQLKNKRKILYSLLLISGLPAMAVTIPLYQMFFYLRIIDSIFFTIVLMIAGGIPYGVWLMKNFIDAVPVELEESAWVDGATRLQGIRRILFPVMLPGIFTIFIFNFAGTWGNFFTPFIFLNSSEKFPIAVTIYQFFGNYGMVEYGQLAAFSLLYTAPSIILYFIAQKYLSDGFRMGGATKG